LMPNSHGIRFTVAARSGNTCVAWGTRALAGGCRVMGVLGLAGMVPGPNTSRPHPQHKVYLAQGRGGDTAQPGVTSRHYVHPTGAGGSCTW